MKWYENENLQPDLCLPGPFQIEYSDFLKELLIKKEIPKEEIFFILIYLRNNYI
jgi:hypothetical protein